MNPTVIGMRGYTQGVKLVAIPAAREIAIARRGADWIADSRLLVKYSIIDRVLFYLSRTKCHDSVTIGYTSAIEMTLDISSV